MKIHIHELEALFALVNNEAHAEKLGSANADARILHPVSTDSSDCREEQILILTPNRRLSRFVMAQYGLYQSSKGHKAWPTFPCMSLNSWYQILWEEMCFSPSSDIDCHLQMNTSQEVSIWLDIICSNSDGLELFNPSAAASACRRAWHTLVQWKAQCDTNLEAEPGASQEFIAWIKAYKALCKQKGLIDSPSAINLLIESIREEVCLIPEKIVLFAFDDVNPQLKHLCGIAEQRGTVVEEFSIARKTQRLCRVALPDVDMEITTAARWASAIIRSDPDASVGIVVPQLLPLRSKVERIFTEVFEPQYVMPESERHASGFNISAAIPLSSTPPVAAALLALKLNFHELEIEDVSKILHSPFIGEVKEIPSRALFDSTLRERTNKIRVSSLRQMAGGFINKYPSNIGAEKIVNENDDAHVSLIMDFYQRLQGLHKSLRGVPKKQSPSLWATLFADQLAILGWPGSRALDTLEFQQVEIWQQSLSQLNTFDYIFPEVSLAKCIELLERIAFDTQFQAQTYDSSVQILGVFEAAGMAFDYLWVMNFDNESWPPPINPSSLLPQAMQKREVMPMASVERELMLSKQLTERFKSSACHVVFSYCDADGDKQLQASPLIEDVAVLQYDDLSLSPNIEYLDTIFKQGGIEAFVDSCGPRITNPKLVRGGTQILKDQAACPFRAFAHHRLKARAFDSAVTGLNAAERGILIHSALEIIWKKLRYQKRLLELDDAGVDSIIGEGIDKSFDLIERSSLDGKNLIGERLKQLERERIHKLLRAWFELEKQRAPFTVIFSETKKTLHLAKLPIHIRYDRIDKLEDGSLFIVDYKTGKLETRSWAGDRPDEPQVPIYGVANREKVSGVAFGQINVDQIAYKGISENPDSIPGVPTPEILTRLALPDSWPEILDHWRDVLESLAKEYIAGFADVKPKHNALSCRYCSLHSLCRIKEYIEVDEDEEESSAEEGRVGVES